MIQELLHLFTYLIPKHPGNYRSSSIYQIKLNVWMFSYLNILEIVLMIQKLLHLFTTGRFFFLSIFLTMPFLYSHYHHHGMMNRIKEQPERWTTSQYPNCVTRLRIAITTASYNNGHLPLTKWYCYDFHVLLAFLSEGYVW